MFDRDFQECLVWRKPAGYASLLKYLTIALAILFALIGVMYPIMYSAAIAMVAVRLFAVPRLYLEYEYIFMKDTLRIDKIINQNGRKRALEVEMSHVEIIAPEKNAETAYYVNNKKYIPMFCDSNLPDHDRFCIAYNNGGDSRLIYFEPHEDLLKALKYHYPRKVIVDQ